MPLLDPIPSLLRMPTSPLSSGNRCSPWSPGFAASPSVGPRFSPCALHRRRLDHASASADGRSPLDACRAGVHSAGRALRSHGTRGQGADSRCGFRSQELQAVARLANDVAAWQALLQTPPVRLVGRLPGCRSFRGVTQGLRSLAESIERKIQPDGTLADDASPELNRIRREQERQQRVIEESLRAALRKLSSGRRDAG